MLALLIGAVVVAQSVERSLPTPEVRGSNPVISIHFYMEHLDTVNCIEKTKIKKRGQKLPIFKSFIALLPGL